MTNNKEFIKTRVLLEAQELIEALDKLIPNPRCELNYNRDYELLIATVLSAQATDKRVNMVTEILFKKYNLEALANARNEEIESIIEAIEDGRFK